MSIVITGNPGVGKHTIAKEISKRLELPISDINSIAKDAGLFEKNDDTNDVNVSDLKKIIKEKIHTSTLIVGHLAPYVLSPDQIKKVIVLRRDPYDLISVYKKRQYTEEKTRENIGSEILGIIAHDAVNQFGDKVFQVDVTGKSIMKVTEKVLRIINDERINDEVDWLDLVTKRNDLKKFFTY
ncbi:MAG TPA: AAA family ATPase [Nitrosarchaeum sp.]|jgi:adenylate kinase|nr:AAA family ATPase [Nitrosarchaeum sp.]